MAEKDKRNTQEQQGTTPAPAENGAAVVAPVKKELGIVRGVKWLGGKVVSGAKKLGNAAKEHPIVSTGLAFGVGVGTTLLVNHFFGETDMEDVIDVDAVEVETPEIPEVEVPELPELPVEEVLEDLPEIPEVPSVEGIFDEI